MPVITSNQYLEHNQMIDNAQFIMDFLYSAGWSKNAICGVLGNMETESTMNSGLWESLDEGNMSNGFGLVQWTPVSDLVVWLDANGYKNNWTNITGQLKRLLAEVKDGGQWYTKAPYTLTFTEFTHSTQTPEYLAGAFIKCYERPYNSDQPIRGTQATVWFNLLTPNGTPPVDPPVDPVDPNEIPPLSVIKLKHKFIYGYTDSLFGRKFSSSSITFIYISAVGNKATIIDKSQTKFIRDNTVFETEQTTSNKKVGTTKGIRYIQNNVIILDIETFACVKMWGSTNSNTYFYVPVGTVATTDTTVGGIECYVNEGNIDGTGWGAVRFIPNDTVISNIETFACQKITVEGLIRYVPKNNLIKV